MTLPAFIFGSLIAVLIGSLFHLVVGGNLRKYILFLFFTWLGFWIGHYISNRMSFTIWRVGLFDLGFDILSSIIVVLIIFWIDKGSVEEKESKEEE